MGLIRKTLAVGSLGVVNGSSKKQRVARATMQSSAASAAASWAQQRAADEERRYRYATDPEFRAWVDADTARRAAEATAAAAQRRRKNLRILAVAAPVGLLLVIIGAVSGGGNSPPSASAGAPATDAGAGKYDQTWSKDYASTSCRQFNNAMTPQQRFAASADMLTGARDKGDGGTGVPGDGLVNSFKMEVDLACEAMPTMTLTDAAVGVYLTERATYRP